MQLYSWIWLAVLVGFILLEALTVQLVSLWFILGAAAAFVVSLLRLPFPGQLGLFLAVSVLTLVVLRPLLAKKVTPKKVPTNADMSIGKIAVVRVPIDNDLEQGRVYVDGLEWAARSKSGEPIEKDTKVLVEAIDGVKLIVKPL